MLRHDDYTKYLSTGPKLPGLTTREEQAWCQWYGAEGYEGAGAIVELGPWLGSLTTNLCRGLAQNPRARDRRKYVFTYDLFEWHAWCEAEAKGTEHEGQIPVGSCFMDYYARRHREYADALVIHKADLTTQRWHEGPIALILNDAVKTIEIGRNVFSQFVPSLTAGVGLIAHQDFLWPTEAFLFPFMYLVRDAFAVEYAVPNSCMIVFRCTRGLDLSRVALPACWADISESCCEEAFAWGHSVLTSVEPKMVELCRAVTLWRAGHKEAALRVSRDARLAEKCGNSLYDFQVDVLRSWGYPELLK